MKSPIQVVMELNALMDLVPEGEAPTVMLFDAIRKLHGEALAYIVSKKILEQSERNVAMQEAEELVKRDYMAKMNAQQANIAQQLDKLTAQHDDMVDSFSSRLTGTAPLGVAYGAGQLISSVPLSSASPSGVFDKAMDNIMKFPKAALQAASFKK